MAEVPDDCIDNIKVFVKEYNSTSKTLTLILMFKDFGSQTIGDPTDYIIEQLLETYQYGTAKALEETYGIMQIENGDILTHYTSGSSIEIQEDYYLTHVEYDLVVPGAVVDPKALLPFKYNKMILTYTWEDTGSGGLDPLPEGVQTHYLNNLDSWYGRDVKWGNPGIDLEQSKEWHAVWKGAWYNLPEGHWRYSCNPQWFHLLSARPASSDAWMLEDVYDCFVRAESSDGGPWMNGENPWYVSRGINNDYVDTYDELKSRDYAPNGYRRPRRWLALADIDERLLQYATEDYVQIEVYPYDEEGEAGERVAVGGVIPAIKAGGEAISTWFPPLSPLLYPFSLPTFSESEREEEGF